MSREEAHAVLNAAKAGQPTPLNRINEALAATGDFGPLDPTPLPLYAADAVEFA